MVTAPSSPTLPLGAPHVCTSFTLRSLSRKISQLYDTLLAPSGLRGTQFSLLAQARAHRADPLSVSALAERLSIDRTTMTRNLRTLQSAGWIHIVQGRDARSRCVIVTEEGETAFRHGLRLWKKAQAEVRQVCGTETIDGLVKVAQHMMPLLDERLQDDPQELA